MEEIKNEVEAANVGATEAGLGGPIGITGASYSVLFHGGKLLAKVEYVAGAIDGSINLSVDSDKVLDAIAAAIPGQIDDAIIAVIKAALKSVG